ncbi:MAG: hypothetical protein HY319_19515 [Armatimonadetes bacterium]|nr:hypothetical protein [Armatimonadota bacterium]
MLRIILSSEKTGVAAALWQQFQLRRFQLVTSEALLLEFQKVLGIPKAVTVHGWTAEEIAAYVDSLRNLALVTPGTTHVDLPAVAQRDPSDLLCDRQLDPIPAA